uniref:Uncharacterized protein n=1 Tax=Utricularia reniformis TaxID=192314 RepID=A0A1Y0AZ27_9LAMI|nr:hypothetical protein AEK19_MT0862 [Utricularia reniformis]YP_009382273.1 hypothetical protein AEK19_MT1847 [Utricularia reniformis]ART30322.1 hypothetical protein AEK19_MT0862 [Utricularia reniformis]ART30411.1 hypothetical protein AEK19_MT1847 [Utricularia reniformis]
MDQSHFPFSDVKAIGQGSLRPRHESTVIRCTEIPTTKEKCSLADFQLKFRKALALNRIGNRRIRGTSEKKEKHSFPVL